MKAIEFLNLNKIHNHIFPKGIKTTTLEGLLEEYVTQENATLKAQRDELLEALKKIYQLTDTADPSGIIDEVWDISKAVIENCK